MIAPILKPDEPPAPKRRLPRVAILAASGCLVFAALSAGLVRLLPAPHSRAQYLIIGTLATIAAMITIYIGLLLSRAKPASPSKPDK